MVGQARRNDFDTVTEMEYRKSAVTLSSAATYTYTTTFIPIRKQKEKAVVVQWSAHPTWYPKLLSALPKFPNNSLSRGSGGRWFESNPWRLLLMIFLVVSCLASYNLCFTQYEFHALQIPFHDIFMT
jgi:hypothetical protein